MLVSIIPLQKAKHQRVRLRRQRLPNQRVNVIGERLGEGGKVEDRPIRQITLQPINAGLGHKPVIPPVDDQRLRGLYGAQRVVSSR